jgi:hypothetical protein
MLGIGQFDRAFASQILNNDNPFCGHGTTIKGLVFFPLLVPVRIKATAF